MFTVHVIAGSTDAEAADNADYAGHEIILRDLTEENEADVFAIWKQTQEQLGATIVDADPLYESQTRRAFARFDDRSNAYYAMKG